MLIHVKYSDDHFDYVSDRVLQMLIESKKIVAFMRSYGWVDIAKDPVRKFQRTTERMPADERRNMVHVEYDDQRYDYVSNSALDRLLESKKILKFQRKDGWATVGVDPIRKTKRDNTQWIQLQK